MNPELESIVNNHYMHNYSKVQNNGCVGYLMKFAHRSLEYGFRKDNFFSQVLEIGSGNAEHAKYVKFSFDTYVMLDLRKSFSITLPDHFKFVNGDAHDLPFADASFDRVIVTCLLHHLINPVKAMEEMLRVTKPGGIISIFLPHDPSIAYRTVRKITSSAQAKRLQINDYSLVHAVEHRNHIFSLEPLINFIFQKNHVVKKSYPIKFLPLDFNIYSIFTVVKYIE